MVILFHFIFSKRNFSFKPFCQAQPSYSSSWAEHSLIITIGPNRTDPNRPDPTRTGIVPRFSSRLSIPSFKGTRGRLRSSTCTKPNQTYQAKPCKPNIQNQTWQTKPTKSILPNQVCLTKPTKANLLK